MIRFDLVEGPASEPVTSEDLKAHAKIESDWDEAVRDGFIPAAREMVEKATGRALITQTWRATLPAWPEVEDGERHRRIRLAQFPVQEIESVTVDGVAIDAALYRLDGKHLMVSIEADDSEGEIDDAGVRIDFTAGYGDDAGDVPASLKTAILMLAAHLYRARGVTSPQGIYHQVIPYGVDMMLTPYKILEI